MARTQASVGGVILVLVLGSIKICIAIERHHSSSSSYDGDYSTVYNSDYTTTPSLPPRFASFDRAGLASQLQGVWIIAEDILSIDGSKVSRLGEVTYKDAPMTVHTPCSFAVEHDGGAYEASFAVVAGGVRFDDYNGAVNGDQTVVCNGPDIYVIDGDQCVHWSALEEDEWQRETDACSATSDPGGTLTVTTTIDALPMKLRHEGEMLVPVASGDATPVRYPTVEAAQAARAERRQKLIATLARATSPDLLDEAVEASELDPMGVEVALRGVVREIDPDNTTVTLAKTKAAEDDEQVSCVLPSVGKLKVGKTIAITGTIADYDESGNVQLDPCALKK